MKFKAGSRRQPIDYEKDLISYWKEHKTFEKSVEQRPADNAYVFYDGPPFITGIPHHGTLLTSVVKDAVPRYQTMLGKRVERVWGWDCHGLPAEVFTEKKLGIHDKRDIGTKISLEEYITTCRANMVQTGDLWESTIDRIGRWVDFQGAYKTMDKNYMESVWWAFKQLYEKGKIYEGEKVLLYCVRDATPISKAEVAMDNSYQDVTDPSVYVKFKLKHENAYLLAWTTTPWTLPANTAIGVGKDQTYTEVKLASGERLILLKSLIPIVLTDEKHQPVEFEVVKDLKGTDLIGKEYEPLFTDRGENAHKIWDYPGLSTEEGTGIVHLAPAYGEEDYELSRQMGFPLVSNIDDNGFYTEGGWQGQYVWDVNKPIAKELHEHGVVWKIDYITHSYPHCHRCHTKLMYRAHPSWFMDIDGQRQEMLEQNSSVNWFPPHIKHGRSEKTIQSAPDWNLSRDRFWATAMPVWKGKDNNGNEFIKVIGSYAELKELSGVELEDYHRPWIDDVTFTIDNVEYKRIDKVLDCWFESGSMPFAQFHYPFENIQKFEDNFPGDFIVEYVPQVRAWFYYMAAVNVGLFDKVPFKTALVHGTLAGNDGRKMSKSFGNYTDPNVLMDEFSADALRLLFLSSSLLNGEDYSLQDKDVSDVNRKLAMIWNMYDFFTTYASVDGWEWNGKLEDPTQECSNPLDIWILSRLHELTATVTAGMDAYDIPGATKAILPFVDDASNWYVRRSRRRFWKSGDDADKQQAYKTLHFVLVRLSLVLAPFTPFLAEELYQKLTGGESVHLEDWPAAGHINELVLSEMSEVRDFVNQALALRAENRLKVRQPLALLSVPKLGSFVDYVDILKEEVNVKAVEQGSSLELDISLTPSLIREGQMREVIRLVQNARKKAGLNVDDRIALTLHSESPDLTEAISSHRETIIAETLATSLKIAHNTYAYGEIAKVDGQELELSLEKREQ
jgi:isoleucyl-tRNA synthetase